MVLPWSWLPSTLLSPKLSRDFHGVSGEAAGSGPWADVSVCGGGGLCLSSEKNITFAVTLYEENHPGKSINRILILCASSWAIPTLARILYFRIF